MRHTKLSFQIAVLLLFLLALPGAVVHAQDAEEWYCPQTGHSVTGAFLALYNNSG